LNDSITILLAGIGGYGTVYLEDLLDASEAAKIPFRIAGAVDPEPDRCPLLKNLTTTKVPVYPSLEAFYEKERADLVVISSPIHLHCTQTCYAVSRGSHVLCEKPVAATVQEVDRMIAYRDRFDRKVGIGFQWSFSESIQALKTDIQKGLFGAPKRLKSLCLWPRDEAYFKRNEWAGRIKDDQGRWILDRPLNNAMAHDLHNMLYLLGDRKDRSARPVRITAELYRANAIENFDTAAVRITTDSNTEILFLGSHAIKDSFGPIFSFEFTDASVVYPGGPAPIQIRFNDGTVKEYPPPDHDKQTKKLWMSIEAAAGIDHGCIYKFE